MFSHVRYPLDTLLAVVVYLFIPFAVAFSADLLETYQAALVNDPVFKIAYDQYLANTEAVPQALSALLPHSTFSSSIAHHQVNDVAAQYTTRTPYTNTIWQISISQAIFNYQAWKKVRQAKASIKAAHAHFNDAAQRLMLRVAKAYLDLLLAQDILTFSKMKKSANQRQYKQATARFKAGLDAITPIYEAKAAYEQSTAEVLAAVQTKINKSEALHNLTNHVYEQLAPLQKGRIPLIKPNPNNPDAWVRMGLQQNYALLAARFELDAAREKIKAEHAAGWPTISLNGNKNYTRNYLSMNDSVFVPTSSNQASVTLNLNFPFLQGGLVTSKRRQAAFSFQAAIEKLEKLHRDIASKSRIAYHTLTNGLALLAADRQTVIARVEQVKSASAQYRAGMRSMFEVAQLQTYLFDAQVRLARDQYTLIKMVFDLKYLAGTLNANDLAEVNSWLDLHRLNQ